MGVRGTALCAAIFLGAKKQSAQKGFPLQSLAREKKEIIQALKNDFTDFEDSVQYSSALTIKDLDVIITRNTKDYRNSSIAVMTPLNFLKMIEKDER